MVQDIYGNEISPQAWPNMDAVVKEYGQNTTAIFDLNDFSDDEKPTKSGLLRAIAGLALNTQPKKLESLSISELQGFLASLQQRRTFIASKLVGQSQGANEQAHLQAQEQNLAQRARALETYIEFRRNGGLTNK
jgi:Fe-S-cluster formation regulator IscX/YfhJ